MKAISKVLDGVPIKTTTDGTLRAVEDTHCSRDCPLLTYNGGTVCALEQFNQKRKDRYDREADAWKRCPACLRLERKG